MPTTLSAQESMGTIDAFIQQVGAAEKRAGEALSEPGSIGGETSHPVKNVDDRLEKAKEGERSAENEADVKKDQGKPSVENAPEGVSKSAGWIDLSRFARPTGRTKVAGEGKSSGGSIMTPGSAADDHQQIGTKVEPTGEDPSVETGSAKAGKEDPGSSHPARTDNKSLDGHKFAADIDSMPLEKLAALVADLGNDFCAAVAVDEPQAQQFKQASDNSLSDAQLAQQAGWELAGLFTGDFDKRAADALVQNTLTEIIKTAADDGTNVADYLDSYFQAEKTAAGEDPMADPSQAAPPPAGDPTGGAGGAGGGPMMGGMGGGDPAAAGGDPMAGGAGGAGGGDPMMGALGGGGGDPSGGAGGGQPDPQTLELARVLEELGVTPEELEQAMQQEQGGAGAGAGAGAGGEMGGDAGGAPPPDASGGGEPAIGKTAGDRTKQAAVKRGNNRQEVREYITEVISRSRRNGK